jgi:hypothetical protein
MVLHARPVLLPHDPVWVAAPAKKPRSSQQAQAQASRDSQRTWIQPTTVGAMYPAPNLHGYADGDGGSKVKITNWRALVLVRPRHTASERVVTSDAGDEPRLSARGAHAALQLYRSCTSCLPAASLGFRGVRDRV